MYETRERAAEAAIAVSMRTGLSWRLMAIQGVEAAAMETSARDAPSTPMRAWAEAMMAETEHLLACILIGVANPAMYARVVQDRITEGHAVLRDMEMEK